MDFVSVCVCVCVGVALDDHFLARWDLSVDDGVLDA